MQLHSLFLNTEFEALEYQTKVITQLLTVCPRLRTLVLCPSILKMCLEQKPTIYLPSLTCLRFFPSYIEDMPDAVLLAGAFPNISHLSFGQYLDCPSWKSIELILRLVDMFPCLHRLDIGDFKCRSENTVSDLNVNVMNILESGVQLRSSNCSITMYERGYLCMWL